MDRQHTILNTTVEYRGWTKLLRAVVKTPTGDSVHREIEDHGAAVCVLPYNPGRRTAVLVRQFRAPVSYCGGDGELLEAIAGLLEHETPQECARREGREETGLELEAPEFLFSAWTMPGLSTERMHFFLATYSADVQSGAILGARDEHEATTALEIGLRDLAHMIQSGQIADVKTLLLLQTLRLRRPEIFAT
jgi:nudix-type nucleoside diphosphatase (YffH/AdpP family)